MLVEPQTFRERKLGHWFPCSVHKREIGETFSAIILAVPCVLTGAMFWDPVQFGTLNVPEASIS